MTETGAGSSLFTGIEDLAAQIPDGSALAIVKDDSGAPMEVIRALIRRKARDLHLVTIPTGVFAAELLVGAGCVTTIETSGVSLGEFGGAPRFSAAVRTGAVTIMDATCPAIYAALQAGEKGIPFMPIRGILGADLMVHRDDWKLIDNPFAEGGEADPIVLLPAIRPDVALIHAAKSDRNGNIWIGRERENATMAHAAAKTLVTVEEIVDEDFLADEDTTAGCLPAFYVDAIAEAKEGAWPIGFMDAYPRDDEHLTAYARDARSDEGFQRYLDEHVLKARPRQAA